jgi:hypothetical protein
MRHFIGYRLPVILYSFTGIGCLVQGIRYFFSDQIMPYHLAVLNTSWDQMNVAHQTLMLGLLKGFGAGSFAVGLGVLLLSLVPLRAGHAWARWATPVVALTYAALIFHVTRFGLLPDAVPVTVSTIVLGLVLAALLCSVTRKAPEQD